ncbi:glutathione S-transferase theta-1-like [Protopterus annectens]|uniref:glutathione S-transferase theta-1-like n=1 Tax=Protopterus annectens TaxID=7888 RepID=UPI001CF9354B|nr:glutathione S-transferase theta-1-like [Protopterus annectens]
MGLELHLDLLSPPCRTVYIFAKKNGIPFEFKEVELMKGDHMSEEFGKVNPVRKVPALKDGDFTLAESVAILLYLARKYKVPDHWYPADLEKRAKVDEFMSWHITTLRQHTGKAFWLKTMAVALLGKPLPPEKIEAGLQELHATLKQLEELFLQDKPFVTGDKISLADLLSICDIMQSFGGGHDVFEGRPKLAAWHQRVESEIGVELFTEANRGIQNAKSFSEQKIPPEVAKRLMVRLQHHLGQH